jgi:iron complex transport system substrate-binding protein
MLFAIGAGQRVVGVGHECDWPPEAMNRPRVTRTLIDSQQRSGAIDEQVRERFAGGLPLYEVDAELLAGLAPDLIVTQAQCDVCAVRYADVVSIVERSPALRGTKLVALAPRTLPDIFQDIECVGEAAGLADAAHRYVAGLRDRTQAVQSRVQRLRRPRTICIEWVEPLMLAANWTPTLIELAGGEAGLVQANAHSRYHAWEEIVRYDPEFIFLSPCGFDLPRSLAEAEQLRRLPGWNELAATRARQVFVIDGNAYLNRSGPRIVDSLEILAHILHPQACEAVCGGWQRLER